MITKTYKCDLCKREVDYPYGGYHLTFSGDGAISFVFLDKESSRPKNEAIICTPCAIGLRYAVNHLPKNPCEEDDV
jgi:hypothetical protein